MLLPETVPVYVTTPTAPKLIELPVTVPLMFRLSGGDVSMMVPSSAPVVCVHVSVKLPLNGPLYVPFHVPERSTVAGAWVGAAVGVAVDAVDWLGVGVPPDDSPQPASTPAATTMLATMSLVPLFMCCPPFIRSEE